jgi:hypothetical protein
VYKQNKGFSCNKRSNKSQMLDLSLEKTFVLNFKNENFSETSIAVNKEKKNTCFIKLLYKFNKNSKNNNENNKKKLFFILWEEHLSKDVMPKKKTHHRNSYSFYYHHLIIILSTWFFNFLLFVDWYFFLTFYLG